MDRIASANVAGGISVNAFHFKNKASLHAFHNARSPTSKMETRCTLTNNPAASSIFSPVIISKTTKLKSLLRVHIPGTMKGVKEHKKAFADATKQLRGTGHFVFGPAEKNCQIPAAFSAVSGNFLRPNFCEKTEGVPGLEAFWGFPRDGGCVCVGGMVSNVVKEERPNLFLVGFMGTGKSALGRILAERWQCPFVDTDGVIKDWIQMPIGEFFQREGEGAFRELERRCILENVPRGGAVVSCGGGLVVPEGRARLLRERGVVVCLFASPETVLKRTMESGHRPLLAGVEGTEALARIRGLLAEREGAYARAGTGILTDGRSLSDLAGAVERIYRREAALWQGHGGAEGRKGPCGRRG
jgi:shikimate kinase